MTAKVKQPECTYDKCPVCKLKIRCRNVDKHEAGIHHRKRQK